MAKKRLGPVIEAMDRQSVKGRLQLGNVLAYFERSEYTTADGLNQVLDKVDQILVKESICGVTRRSVQNIVFELASNSLIHNSAGLTVPELLVLALNNEQVEVWMFGGGRATQISRLGNIIKAINESARPPHHQAQLLARRDALAWRNRNSAPSARRGAGLGMLTIAALSSAPLYFYPNQSGRNASFALQSIV